MKQLGDGLTATAQAGIQYKNGAGLAAKAKAAVLSGRATAELELFGWQIEFGVVIISTYTDEITIAENNGVNVEFDDFKLNVKVVKV